MGTGAYSCGPKDSNWTTPRATPRASWVPHSTSTAMASARCPAARSRSQIDHTATAATGVAKTAIPAKNRWNVMKSPRSAPQTMAPATRSAAVPRYRSASIEPSLRTTNQAIAMARNAPAPSVMMAMDSRQDALNGDTPGASPLAPTRAR